MLDEIDALEARLIAAIREGQKVDRKRRVAAFLGLFLVVGGLAFAATNGYEIKENYTTIVGMLAKTSAPSFADGDYVPLQSDTSGGLRVALASGASSSEIQGTTADGSTASTKPVRIAGKDDGGLVQDVRTTSTGEVIIAGNQTDGALASGGPVQTGGVDGAGNVQALAVDLIGRAIVVGTTGAGAAVTGNPVIVGGSDGSGNARSILTDTGGAVQTDIETIGGVVPAFGAGAVGATVQRVTQATDDAGVASLGVIDDWDESDRAKVNPIVGQAGVTGGSGVVGAATQRVVLATDVGLPAGTSNIGDVDVLTMPADATELPAAGALSDALANPTTPMIGSASLAWDGTQWLRDRGDATSGLYVQAHSPRLKTFRATFNVAAGAAGTAVEVLGPTSGSSEILEIYLTKPSAAVTLTINKRSAASTGGTAGTAPTLVPNDATFAAATSVVKIFTGDPTEGTLVGEVFRRTFATTDDVAITYGTGIDGPFTLNAAAQALTIETSAAATIVGHVVFLER